MLFNPDISKQAVEVIFSNKHNKSIHPPLIFNGIPVKLVDDTKHLGMILDNKLSFEKHIDVKLAKARQGLGIINSLKNGFLAPFWNRFINFTLGPISIMET